MELLCIITRRAIDTVIDMCYLYKMNQYLVFWACLLVFAVGCPNLHTADRIDNAAISAQHDIALNACLEAEAKELQAKVDKVTAHTHYVACANKADKDYGRVK